MRRADRLFQLVQLIRGRRLSTAAWLAQRLEVSLRTVYRDVADLQAQGVPIEGEAGVGYRLGAGFDLPPLMFTLPEAQALVAAVRLVQGRLDPQLAAHAEAALSRILAVLPGRTRAAAEQVAIHAPALTLDARTLAHLATLRTAVDQRQKLRVRYEDQHGHSSERVLRPLGCFFWGPVWTLGAWCEQRQDFRSFRLDRLHSLEVLDERFADEAGKTLADLCRAVQQERPRPAPDVAGPAPQH